MVFFAKIFAVENSREPGPLLAGLMQAQATDRAVLRQPNLGRYARGLIEICEQLENPVVWPVGPAGERLAGAASVLATNGLEVWDRHHRLDGRAVIVVAVSDVSGRALSAAALQARRMGAVVVDGCGVSVEGTEAVEGLRSFRVLKPAVSVGEPARSDRTTSGGRREPIRVPAVTR